jgi:hypothetical protein
LPATKPSAGFYREVADCPGLIVELELIHSSELTVRGSDRKALQLGSIPQHCVYPPGQLLNCIFVTTSGRAHRPSDGLAGLLLRADCYWLRRLFAGQRRSLVSLHRLIQSHFRMVLAGFVIALITMFRRRAMAFGGVLMFLRSGSVRVNCMGFFIHGNAPSLCGHYSFTVRESSSKERQKRIET